MKKPRKFFFRLMRAFILVSLLGASFAVGIYSGFSRNFVFDVVKSLQDFLEGEPKTEHAILDSSPATQIDTTFFSA